MTKKKESKSIDFEASLETLNQLIETMEAGNLPLEQSLEKFESGIKLIRQCQNALKEAEQKVQILTRQNQEQTLEPFQSDDSNT